MNSPTPTTHPGKLAALQQCPLDGKDPDISMIMTTKLVGMGGGAAADSHCAWAAAKANAASDKRFFRAHKAQRQLRCGRQSNVLS